MDYQKENKYVIDMETMVNFHEYSKEHGVIIMVACQNNNPKSEVYISGADLRESRKFLDNMIMVKHLNKIL